MKIIFTLFFIVSIHSVISQNLLASSELEAQNVNKVEIEGRFVDVYIKRGDKVYFKGEIYGNGDKDDYDFDTRIEGSTLVVKIIFAKNNYSWRGSRVRESRIELTVKDGVDLEISNSSGDIYVQDVNTSNAVFEASSGDINLKNILANVDIQTSSGDVDIKGLTGDTEIGTTSGDQKIVESKGNLINKASSGDITILGFEGDLDIKATSGDVEFRNGAGKVNVKTSSGEIEGDNITVEGDCIFDATSGNIDVSFSNDVNSLSFHLTATSGDLSVGNKSSEKKLLLDRGGHKITGVSSSGDQDYQ